MIKNYFFLIRQCRELSFHVTGATLAEAFTQEKDILMLTLQKDNHSILSLELSCAQQSAHILLRDQFNRARKNTIGFFAQLIGGTLLSIEIAGFERIIRFVLSTGTLYYRIHGSRSNVICALPEQEPEYFLKDEENETGFMQLPFANPEVAMQQAINEIQESYSAESEKYNRVLGKEIVDEVRKRSIQNDLPLAINMSAVLNEVFYAPFILAAFTNPPKLLACPETFQETKQFMIRESAEVNEIIRYRLSEQFRVDSYKKQFVQVQKYLQKEQAFLSQKISNMQKVVLDSGREQLYKKCGDLLLSNLHLIEEKTEKILLPDFETDGASVEIKLDSALTPAHNAEVYYAKARNAGKQRQQFAKDLPALEKKLQRLIEQEKKLEMVKDLKEIQKLADEVLNSGRNKESKDTSPESKFRRFYVFDQYMILVGKDAHNNDVLTVQYAKPNDFWFHARSVSGSHVVVRNEGNKDTLDKTVLQAAASLAAFYSKAKSAKLVPVAFTQKKYVVKRKGMNPGMVGLLKEKVVMVKPEIPAICIPYGAKDAEE